MPPSPDSVWLAVPAGVYAVALLSVLYAACLVRVISRHWHRRPRHRHR